MAVGLMPTNVGRSSAGGNRMNTKKSLGQHWLYDDVSLEAMCLASDLQIYDAVLEIGPGTGTLTSKLLARGVVIHAVEKDNELVEYIESHFKDQINRSNLVIHNADILQFDMSSLPKEYKVVANIPYYLTSHLLRILSESLHPPIRAVLLVQKEVAERVCAGLGNMSILAVTTQFYWHTSLGAKVSAKLFTPPPKIDSQILILKRREQKPFNVDEKMFFRIVKIGFSNKRKILLNSLAAGLQISKTEARLLLEKAKLQPTIRPQELSLQQWYRLYTVLYGK